MRGMIKRPLRTGQITAVLFFFTVILTLLFLTTMPTDGETDNNDFNWDYRPTAVSLLEGRGFTTQNGQLLTRFPPGFPTILAALIGSAQVFNLSESFLLRAFILFCAGATTVLVFLLARMIWKNTTAAVFAALMWMTYPFAMWLFEQTRSEAPFLVALYSTLFLLWYSASRQKRSIGLYFLCGVLFGITMLIRPAALGIGVVAALAIYLLATASFRRSALASANATTVTFGVWLRCFRWNSCAMRPQPHTINLTGCPSFPVGSLISPLPIWVI